MKPPDNLPPLPPVPKGFDRWEYRGIAWRENKPASYCTTNTRRSVNPSVDDWCSQEAIPLGAEWLHYIEAVRDEPKATGIEAMVCADIAARQQKGIEKYGVTVKDSPDDMLRHAYEEALDLAVYLKAELERRGR